jgi:hypothetical protein
MKLMSKETKNLPAVIPEGFTSTPVVYTAQCTVPYVTFVNAKKKIYPALCRQLPSLREGDPVLILPDPGAPVRLSPLKYFLVGREQFWGKYNADGVLTHYSASQPDKTAKFTEIMETVALVFVGPKLLVPASIRFKGAQIPGVSPATRALDEAKLPLWIKKSEEHATTAAIEVSWARFTATTNRGAERETQTPDEKGQTFRYQTLEKAAINPTDAEEYALLRSFFSADEFKKVYADVVENCKTRIADAKKKAVK